MLPIFLLGGALAYARLYYMWSVAMKFKKEWREGMRYKDVYRFREPYDVEIVSRVMRVWEEDDETLDPDALDLAETVYKVRTTWGVALGSASLPVNWLTWLHVDADWPCTRGAICSPCLQDTTLSSPIIRQLSSLLCSDWYGDTSHNCSLSVYVKLEYRL